MKRRDRISHRRDFRRTLAGARIYSSRLLVVLAVPGQARSTRVGVTTVRKFGGAVERNRARRRLRELTRRILIAEGSPLREGLPVDLVLIGRPPLLQASTGEIEAEGERILARVGTLGG